MVMITNENQHRFTLLSVYQMKHHHFIRFCGLMLFFVFRRIHLISFLRRQCISKLLRQCMLWSHCTCLCLQLHFTNPKARLLSTEFHHIHLAWDRHFLVHLIPDLVLPATRFNAFCLFLPLIVFNYSVPFFLLNALDSFSLSCHLSNSDIKC